MRAFHEMTSERQECTQSGASTFRERADDGPRQLERDDGKKDPFYNKRTWQADAPLRVQGMALGVCRSSRLRSVTTRMQHHFSFQTSCIKRIRKCGPWRGSQSQVELLPPEGSLLAGLSDALPVPLGSVPGCPPLSSRSGRSCVATPLAVVFDASGPCWA